MFSAQVGNKEITKYLYDKGAKLTNGANKLTTKYNDINMFATTEIKNLIKQWEAEKNKPKIELIQMPTENKPSESAWALFLPFRSLRMMRKTKFCR